MATLLVNLINYGIAIRLIVTWNKYDRNATRFLAASVWQLDHDRFP